MPPVHQVASQLSKNNIVVNDIKIVKQKERESGWVYKVVGNKTNDRDTTFYVRTISKSVAENVQRVIQNEPEIGMPNIELLDDESPLLIMDGANGRPLSLLLPLLTLPGVWMRNREGLIRGIQEFGQSLGALHYSTEVDRTTLEDARSINHIDFYQGLAQELGSTELKYIEQIWNKFATEKTTVGMSHKDPSPHNIYYTTGTTELIDIAFKQRICLRDIARAEIGIELMIDRLPYGKRTQKRQLSNAFRYGYRNKVDPMFQSDEQVLYEVIKLNQLCHLLSRYLNKSDMSFRNKATKITDLPILKNKIRSTRQYIVNTI